MAEGLMKHPLETARPRSRRLAIGCSASAIVLASALITGCASTPAPTEQLAVSKTAVEDATSAGGTEFAPLELKAAQDKLAAANQAMTEKEYEEARRLAAEAQVDAKLAETKARSGKAQKAVQDTQDSLRVLREEVERNSQSSLQSGQ